MKLLVLDGNSIINRAFYGVKLLTTKDGRFTNAVYGFLATYLRLFEECAPDAVAAAFDVKSPTFRHEMYGEYKAGRHAMPEELAQQLPVVKELLGAMGIRLVELAGFEADDILGTLSRACVESGNECFLATGDRDSLQLVGDNVTVMLTATKMGKPVTTRYTPEVVKTEYGVEPARMTDIKALMGDSSDNIPGVAGIGQKTASDLVSRFGTIDEIYKSLDALDIKQGVRDKLAAGKDSAYLSLKLGTICREVPIDKDIRSYVPSPPDALRVTKLLAELEMFSMIKRLNLPEVGTHKADDTPQSKPLTVEDVIGNENEFLHTLEKDGEAYFTAEYEDGYVTQMIFNRDDKLYRLTCGSLGFPGFMRELLENENIAKHTHNAKPLFAAAELNRIDVKNLKTDILLSAYILNPNASDYSLKRLAEEYGVAAPQAPEGCDGAAALPAICKALGARIASNCQEGLLDGIEIPLAQVLASMESVGFRVDEDGIREFGVMLDSRISAAVSEIFDEVGFEFNLNSPKQLGEALFDKLGLPAGKKTKSGYSTDAEVLEKLSFDYPVVVRILEYRTLTKLRSTYCDGLLAVISPDGRIRSTLKQTETRTGRISSSEPNLQNIPVRSPLGAEMRKFFVAGEGCVLVDADYSQIELRVLSHISADKTMISAFNDGVDIHTVTASQVFDMPLEMVTPLMRTRAKAVNFGIVYGIGAFSLSKDIDVSRAEADRYIKHYLEHYSGVSEYMQRVVERAKKDGYVETMFARRRYLPELTASNANLRSFGERVARNMPIQGTAADIIKIAMVKVYRRLRDENMRAKLIMQVHDELIIEAPESEAQRASDILREEMENAVKLSVKLGVDVGTGRTWYEAKS